MSRRRYPAPDDDLAGVRKLAADLVGIAMCILAAGGFIVGLVLISYHVGLAKAEEFVDLMNTWVDQ